jgi:hypothetical protein
MSGLNLHCNITGSAESVTDLAGRYLSDLTENSDSNHFSNTYKNLLLTATSTDASNTIVKRNAAAEFEGTLIGTVSTISNHYLSELNYDSASNHFTDTHKSKLDGITGLTEMGLTFGVYDGAFSSESTASQHLFFDTRTPTVRGVSGDFTNSATATNEMVTNFSEKSLLFTGYFLAPKTGIYKFFVEGDQQMYMWIGSTALNNYTFANALASSVTSAGFTTIIPAGGASITLTAGVYYPVRIAYCNDVGTYSLILRTILPNNDGTEGSMFSFTSNITQYTYPMAIGVTSLSGHYLSELSESSGYNYFTDVHKSKLDNVPEMGLTFSLYNEAFSLHTTTAINTFFDTHTPTARGVSGNFTSLATATNSTSLSLPMSLLFTGYFLAPITGPYKFLATGNNQVYVWIGSNALSGYTLANASTSTITNLDGTVTTMPWGFGVNIALTAGVYYPIRIAHCNNTGGTSSLNLAVNLPNANGSASTISVNDITQYTYSTASSVASLSGHYLSELSESSGYNYFTDNHKALLTNATDSNTVNTIVKRNTSGDFDARNVGVSSLITLNGGNIIKEIIAYSDIAMTLHPIQYIMNNSTSGTITISAPDTFYTFVGHTSYINDDPYVATSATSVTLGYGRKIMVVIGGILAGKNTKILCTVYKV